MDRCPAAHACVTLYAWLHIVDSPCRYGSAVKCPLIEMMASLRKGQTSRHGSQTPTREETLPEAEMAVHPAFPLVHWLVTGAP